MGIIPLRPSNAMKDQFDLHQLDFGRPVKVIPKIQFIKYIKASQEDPELLEVLGEIEVSV